MRFSPIAALAVLLVTGSNAAAQPSVPLPTPDFLFGRPNAAIGVRGGWAFARAGSDWYNFVTDQLTLDNKDFNAPAIGTDVSIGLTNRVDLVISIDYKASTTDSEYRDFVDNRRLPIAQRTRLREANVGAGIKVALIERGRSISRLAWVPRRFVPYVGAGGGILLFEMMQNGDFVDFVDFSVFSDVFESRGATPSAHVQGGVDVRMWRNVFATFDARYRWAAGDLGADWIDFDPIDLRGTQLSAGLSFAF